VTVDNILLLVAAIVAMIAMGAGMTYWSQRKYDELRRVVAASDDAMQKAAAALGLEFLPKGGYDHPIVGTIPAFGHLSGTLDGIHVEARVDHDFESAFARSELCAKSPSGKGVTLRPKIEKTGSSQFLVYQVLTDPVALAAHLRELAIQARGTP
jgi:hypothetical protein